MACENQGNSQLFFWGCEDVGRKLHGSAILAGNHNSLVSKLIQYDKISAKTEVEKWTYSGKK